MEECRAETVSLYCNVADYSFYAEHLLYFILVVSNPDILKIFNVCLHSDLIILIQL